MTFFGGGEATSKLDFGIGLWNYSPPASKSEGRFYATFPSASRIFARRMGSVGSEPAKLHCSGAARDRKLGGKIEAAWFSFGDYDVVII
jgi:hypothetical protein